MGLHLDALIPVVLLLDNPGITKEEFVRLLDDTKSPSYNNHWYHNGLSGLALLLHLPLTKEYESFLSEKLPKFYRSQMHSRELFHYVAVQEFPHVPAEKLFDFSTESGHLWAERSEEFRWFQRKATYYLDEQYMYDNLSSGRRYSYSFDWTDVVLTREAVRKKSWGAALWVNRDRKELLLKTYPDIIPAYEQAIWDSHTSLFCKRRNLTYTQLLRLCLGTLLDDKGNITC